MVEEKKKEKIVVLFRSISAIYKPAYSCDRNHTHNSITCLNQMFIVAATAIHWFFWCFRHIVN